MDFTQDIEYRNFKLNDSTVADQIDASDGLAKGISGCVVDTFDPDDADVVQFSEKRAEADGLDVGKPFFGGRRIRMTGTIYGKTRALAYDNYLDLRKAVNPVLASREIPQDKGYLPLYFSVPTNDIVNFPSGARDLRALVMPKVFRCPLDRDQHGGADSDGLAFAWNAMFVMRDPNFEGVTPQDVSIPATTIIDNGTATAGTDLVNRTAHGLVALDRIYFTRLGGGGAGLSLGTAYYVSATGLTANAFKVSTNPAGTPTVDITVNYTGVDFAKPATTAGNFLNRGTYNSPLNMLLSVGSSAGTIVVSTAGSNYTITIPATTDQAFTNATGNAGTDLITKAGHGLVASDRIYITGTAGGSGLSQQVAYWVLASGLTANDFKVSLTDGGAAVDITVNYSVINYSKISYRTLRFKREKVFTVEENGVEVLRRSWLSFAQTNTWPLIPEGTSGYTVTVNGVSLSNVSDSHMWFWEQYA